MRSKVRQELLNDIKRASYNTVGQIKVALEAAVKAIQQVRELFLDCLNSGYFRIVASLVVVNEYVCQ